MTFYHINYNYKNETSTCSVKAENIDHAIGKWLILMRNSSTFNGDVFLRFKKILKDGYWDLGKNFLIKLEDLHLEIVIGRDIMEGVPLYDINDATIITLQNLPADTKINLSIKEVSFILSLFYKYRENHNCGIKDGIGTVHMLEGDEKINNSSNKICSYVQRETSKLGYHYSLNNIKEVFLAEKKYLIAAGMIEPNIRNILTDYYDIIDISKIAEN